MISYEHLYEEITKIEDILKKIETGKAEPKDIDWAKIKSNVLVAKLCHDLRSNSVAMMKHIGAELRKGKINDEEKDSKPTKEIKKDRK